MYLQPSLIIIIIINHRIIPSEAGDHNIYPNTITTDPSNIEKNKTSHLRFSIEVFQRVGNIKAKLNIIIMPVTVRGNAIHYLLQTSVYFTLIVLSYTAQ